MERRSFLGVLLGTVAGKNFFGQAPTAENQMKGKYPFYLTFHDSRTGESLQAPGITEMKMIEHGDEYIYTWVAEPLLCHVPLAMDRVYLHKADGTVLHRSLASGFGAVKACRGDTLKVTQSIVAPFKLTFDELADLLMKRPDEKRGLPA